MDRTNCGPIRPVTFFPRRIAVAIPARNESELIHLCLAAVDRAARDIPRCDVTVVVLVNNSTDHTAKFARNFAAKYCTVQTIETILGPSDAHAGGARRTAMDIAAAIAGRNGVIMTTDADSEVSPDWMAANLYELGNGVAAVAGSVALKKEDRARLRPMLVARADEWRLGTLQAKIATLIDPVAHDPWPTHIWEWGASIAVTVAAYRAVGGIPAIPLAEDRAFATLLAKHDFKIRHSHAPVVFTSGRLIGRAPLGFADLLKDYCEIPDAPCDAALEPTKNLVIRLRSRKLLRQTYGDRRGFGALWHDQDNQLTRERLFPAQLANEISYASALVSRLEKGALHPVDNRAAGHDTVYRHDQSRVQTPPSLDLP